jgi:hypothetical protein
MRVNRALEKLQVFLKQRGVTVTAAVLGAALASDTIVPSGWPQLSQPMLWPPPRLAA